MCSALLVWNVILTIQMHNIALNTTDGKTVVHSKVDTSDISSIVAQVKTSVVSIKNHTQTYSGVILEQEENTLYIVSVAECADDVNVSVYFDSGREENAQVIGVDNETDLCVLKTDVDFDVSGFSLKNTVHIQNGENVIGIGGRDSETGNMAIATGVCSEQGVYRMHEDDSWLTTVLSTDMNGTSQQYGGALVDLNGELAGILCKRPYNQSADMQYAISNVEIKKVYDEIRKDGEVKRGSLGIVVRSIKDMESYEKNENGFHLDDEKGLLVTSVPEESCAYAILKRGDSLMTIDKTSVNSLDDLRNLLYKKNSGDEVEITYMRDGESETVTVVLQ